MTVYACHHDLGASPHKSMDIKYIFSTEILLLLVVSHIVNEELIPVYTIIFVCATISWSLYTIVSYIALVI